MLLPEYPDTSSEQSQRTAEVPKQESDPADQNSPDNTPIEVDEHAEQQEAAGENPAAEQVFMYLQVSLSAEQVTSSKTLQHCVASCCMAHACSSVMCTCCAVSLWSSQTPLTQL